MSVVVRIAGLVAWVAAVWGLLFLGWFGVVAAVAVTLLAGALIARWWALLAPVALALFWVVAGFVSDDTSGDADPAFYGILAGVVTVLAAGVLAIGIALGRRWWSRPQDDRRVGVGRPVA